MTTGIRKRTTCTTAVLEWLVQHDDFATRAQIMAGAKLITSGQTTVTLSDLRRCKAIDAIDVDGTLFWFATPHTDTRSRHLDEIREGITRKRVARCRFVIFHTGHLRWFGGMSPNTGEPMWSPGLGFLKFRTRAGAETVLAGLADKDLTVIKEIKP